MFCVVVVSVQVCALVWLFWGMVTGYRCWSTVLCVAGLVPELLVWFLCCVPGFCVVCLVSVLCALFMCCLPGCCVVWLVTELCE